LRIGIVIALIALGPQMLPMVNSGMLDLTTALERAAIVSAICGIGAFYVLRLIDTYRTELQYDRRQAETMNAIEEILRDRAQPQDGTGHDGTRQDGTGQDGTTQSGTVQSGSLQRPSAE
jgi:hypothetical protein